MTFNLPILRSKSTDLENSRANIENLFGELFNDFGRLSFLPDWRKTSLLPKLNISETDSKYYIEAELPGVKQSDVEIKLDNNILIIKGETEESIENEERNYLIRERYHCSFQRSLTLPRNVNEDEIKANFKDCILNIEISKKPETSAKKIDVKTK